MNQLKVLLVTMLLISTSFLSVNANDSAINHDSSKDGMIVMSYKSDLTKSEIDELLIRETEKYLEETIPGYAESKLQRARPKYETVYGDSVYKTLGGYAGNQPLGGNRFRTGGGFYFTDSGGSSVSASISFPKPFRSVSVSVNLGVSGTSGKFVNVPDTTNYYKLYVSKKMYVRPFVVYYIDSNGNKSVYVTNTTQYVESVEQWAKRV